VCFENSLPFAASGSASVTFAAARDAEESSGSNGLRMYSSSSAFCLASCWATRVMTIQILAAKTKSHDGEHQECIRSHCRRALPRASFETTIQKSKRNHKHHEQRRNYQHANNGSRPMPVFQPLKDWHVVPFRTRHILGICWVGRRPELYRDQKARNAEAYDE
jgi:hypothetical protein